MFDLELVGLHDDGEHLVFKDADETLYRLPITEALRAAVRRDRPGLESIRAQSLRPREIQAMIRSGASAEEVADRAGVPIETVRRYEGPVIAEREFAAQRAQSFRVDKSDDAPTLGDLVIDRLAARNIETVVWDAYRPDDGTWYVVARYRAGLEDLQATWSVDLSTETFKAEDDEARWLSEIDLADSSYVHLSAVDDRFYDVETDGDIPSVEETPPPAEDDGDETEAILRELQDARGVRGDVGSPDHDEPTLWDDPPAAHPPLSRPQDATDATILRLPEQPAPESDPTEPEDSEEPTDSSGKRKRGRRGRTSVPSWDEIVFGAKND